MNSRKRIHLFGAATPSGQAFRQLVTSENPQSELFVYSRKASTSNYSLIGDFSQPSEFQLGGDPSVPAILISFAPIWLLAPFLGCLASSHPQRLKGLTCLIACSSSSVLTKRFAANHCDRELVTQLAIAEGQLLAICSTINVRCNILRPTLVYGHVGDYADKNLSRLLKFMRSSPVLPIPLNTGFRQPIHAFQLAGVAFKLMHQLESAALKSDSIVASAQGEIVTIGGDQTLTYRDMLRALQHSQPVGDPARRCLLLSIPNNLFFFLAAPLLLVSPKLFEAVLRIAADLAGFLPSHQLLDQSPKPFPFQPGP